VGKPEEKRSLGRTGRRWMDNIKMDAGYTGWGLYRLNLFGSRYGRVEVSCERSNKPLRSIK
jgi:hypothetical protein